MNIDHKELETSEDPKRNGKTCYETETGCGLNYEVEEKKKKKKKNIYSTSPIVFTPVMVKVSGDDTHHKIRSVIATCLKSNGYTTYEEVHGIADTGSHRRIDIITFKHGETKGYILDPTIRFETYQNQPEEKEEKELVGSLAQKKLPPEGCTGRNGEGRRVRDIRRYQMLDDSRTLLISDTNETSLIRQLSQEIMV
ncbi:hypothetical protein ANN_14921 [Periplaneta americana]|uniref:Uncharacterized protein n=1 Tax=Periplaneta americana TaxID=6978 RepID=A0ABQ8SZ52_PERAM|nr:hypothetical protein ANN_14921 [Periplaneta americana]